MRLMRSLHAAVRPSSVHLQSPQPLGSRSQNIQGLQSAAPSAGRSSRRTPASASPSHALAAALRRHPRGSEGPSWAAGVPAGKLCQWIRGRLCAAGQGHVCGAGCPGSGRAGLAPRTPEDTHHRTETRRQARLAAPGCLATASDTLPTPRSIAAGRSELSN